MEDDLYLDDAPEKGLDPEKHVSPLGRIIGVEMFSRHYLTDASDYPYPYPLDDHLAFCQKLAGRIFSSLDPTGSSVPSILIIEPKLKDLRITRPETIKNLVVSTADDKFSILSKQNVGEATYGNKMPPEKILKALQQQFDFIIVRTLELGLISSMCHVIFQVGMQTDLYDQINTLFQKPYKNTFANKPNAGFVMGLTPADYVKREGGQFYLNRRPDDVFRIKNPLLGYFSTHDDPLFDWYWDNLIYCATHEMRSAQAYSDQIREEKERQQALDDPNKNAALIEVFDPVPAKMPLHEKMMITGWASAGPVVASGLTMTTPASPLFWYVLTGITCYLISTPAFIGNMRERRQRRRVTSLSNVNQQAAITKKTSSLTQLALSQSSVSQYVDDWEKVVARYDAVVNSWLDYEMDISKVIEYPLMSDISCDHTANFHKALNNAKMYKPGENPTIPVTDSPFFASVQELEIAFSVAESHAKKNRWVNLSADHKKALTASRQLVTLSLDESASLTERQNAYRSLRSKLEGVVFIPDRAVHQLEKTVRLEIES